jgi:hypothetical protein
MGQWHEQGFGDTHKHTNTHYYHLFIEYSKQEGLPLYLGKANSWERFLTQTFLYTRRHTHTCKDMSTSVETQAQMPSVYPSFFSSILSSLLYSAFEKFSDLLAFSTFCYFTA